MEQAYVYAYLPNNNIDYLNLNQSYSILDFNLKLIGAQPYSFYYSVYTTSYLYITFNLLLQLK